MDNLLIQAAKEWNILLDYEYEFTYGYRKEEHTLVLKFLPDNFQHLAGFQYLKDLRLPRFSAVKMFEKVLAGNLEFAKIQQGCQYDEMVVPRLKTLVHIRQLLDRDCQLYKFIPKHLNFYSDIRGDFLLVGEVDGTAFVFTVLASKDAKEMFCQSAFLMENRDYRCNQYRYTLLKKVKRNICTGVEQVLYEKDKQEGLKGIGYEI